MTSPRWSQDGAKNEKKNEVNLGRVSVGLGRVEVSPRVLLRGRWGSKGRPKTKTRPPIEKGIDFSSKILIFQWKNVGFKAICCDSSNNFELEICVKSCG